jgi:type I site-specific restriction endonuclease
MFTVWPRTPDSIRRLDVDLKSVKQLQQMIQVAHSGSKKNNGVSMQRLVGILSALDDMAMDAATWKSLAELHMCQQLLQHKNQTRYEQFAIRVNMNSEMLCEVGGQLLHPSLRMASALDSLLPALTVEPARIKPKP